jgi:RNA polymerase sigma factor (sigma-70 family)
MSESPRTPEIEDLLAHSGWVKALARSLVSDPAAADDVEQGAWLVALERPPKHGSNLRSWLGSVVRSVAGQGWRDHQRHQRGRGKLESRARQSATAGISAGLATSTSEAPPEAIAERLDTFQNLAHIVADLEEPYGSAIYLRYFEGLSVQEIATQQGITPANAQTRLRRGLEKLRARMHGRFGGEWKNRCLVFAAPLPAAPVSISLIGTLLVSTKTKIFAAAAVLLAIPLYTIFSAPEEREPLQGAEQALAGAGLAEGPAVKLASNPTTGRVAVVAPTPAVEREYAPASTDPLAHHVTVVDAQSLRPVAGAEVLYFDRGSPKEKEWRRLQFRESLDTESLLERFGTFFLTDENGQTALPPRQSYAWVAARIPGKFAHVYLMEDPQDDPNLEVELLLRDKVDIPVRVLDWQGQPVAGISVAYQSVYAPGWTNSLDRVMTNETGRAVLRNMQDRFADANRNSEHQIAVQIPLKEPVFHVFELDSPPTSELLFRLPETGSVEVTVYNPDGALVRDGYPILLHNGFVGDPSKGEKLSEFPTNHSEGAIAYTKGGKVVFPRVGLNTPLVTFVHFFGNPAKTETRSAGIVDPNKPLLLELRAAARATYDAVLVDENDLPLINASLEGEKELRYANGLATVGAFRDRTDERGAIELVNNVAVPKAEELAGDLGHNFALLSYSDPGRGKLRWGVVDWPVDPSKERVDLGKVVVGPSLIASGQVVNDQGEAIPFAQMYLNVPTPADVYANPLMRKQSVLLHWSCDEQGHFEVRGELGHAPERITMSIAPASSQNANELQEVEFVLGEKNQKLVFVAKAEVEGRILFDAKIPTESLQLRLQVVGAKADEPSTYFLDLDPDNGRFQLTGLPTCTATMQLSAKAGGLILATSEPFELLAGKVSSPTDWAPLDLRGKIWPHTVVVRAPDGSTLDQFTLALPEHNRTSRIRSLAPYTFVTATTQATVRVDAPGYQISDPVLVGEREVISLTQAVPVLIQLPREITLDDPKNWQVEIRFQQAGVGMDWMPGRTVFYSAEDKGYLIQVPAAGMWDLSFFRNVVTKEHAYGTYDRVQFPQGIALPIEVLDQAQVQKITLPLTQQMIQAVLDRN